MGRGFGHRGQSGRSREVYEVTEVTQFLVYLGNEDQSGCATPLEAGGAFGHC